MGKVRDEKWATPEDRILSDKTSRITALKKAVAEIDGIKVSPGWTGGIDLVLPNGTLVHIERSGRVTQDSLPMATWEAEEAAVARALLDYRRDMHRELRLIANDAELIAERISSVTERE